MAAQVIAAGASVIAAVSNIILMILLYRWYGDKPKAGLESQTQGQPGPQKLISEAVGRMIQNRPRHE